MPAHTQAHKPSAPRPSSPASSLHSSPAVSLPSTSPWSPPPLRHKSAHTRVHRRPALQPSSPASSLQSSPAVSLNNSSWSPPPLRHRQRDSHVARHLFRESSAFNLPPELTASTHNSYQMPEPQTSPIPHEQDPVLKQLPATPVLANGIPYERLTVIRSEASSIMNLVIVKKSSPKNLSADCRSTDHPQVSHTLLTANRQVTNSFQNRKFVVKNM